MLHEFKLFAMRGNVVDLAVGVAIGAAFGAIVSSLVGDIIMPIVGIITGGLDFSVLTYKVGNAIVPYGKFIQASFVFFIVAFALFMIVKAKNTLNKKEEAEKAAEPQPVPEDIKLLIEIRDLLKR